MGRRKTKLTAKTGDKAISSYQPSKKDDASSSEDNDDMYSKIDKFHLSREEEDDGLIKLHSSHQQNKDDNEGWRIRENVLDLGLSSSDEEEEEDDEGPPSPPPTPISSSDSSDSEEEPQSNHLRSEILNWGKTKHRYYHGDTADLEIGQEEEEAFEEEEAGKEVLKLRYDEMDEGDFLLFDSKTPKTQTATTSSKVKVGDMEFFEMDQDVEKVVQDEVSKRMKKRGLTEEDERELIEREHEEFFPLAEYFERRAIVPLKDLVSVVMDQIHQNEEELETIGLTPQGKSYLQIKQLLLLTTTLNFANYLLFKTHSTKVKHHPIINRLDELDGLMELMKEKVELPCHLMEQLDKIRKAVRLVQEEQQQQQRNGEDDEEDEDEDEDSVMDTTEEASPKPSPFNTDQRSPASSSSSSSSSSEDEEKEEEEETTKRNESLFGLNSQDFTTTTTTTSSSSSKPNKSRHSLEYGDDDFSSHQITKTKFNLNTTMNKLQQKQQNAKQQMEMTNDEEERMEDEEERMQRGLKMMDAMLGDDNDNEEDDDNSEANSTPSNEFYHQTKQTTLSKKRLKTQRAAQRHPPKYPKLDPLTEGERAVSKTILKNRGLVPHKSKANRNPRVKKREQYRKALIKRKGAVRDVRTGEMDAYGGETTGIKSGISRSRKLGVRKR